jgi:Domain of unknown function (DUF4190)
MEPALEPTAAPFAPVPPAPSQAVVHPAYAPSYPPTYGAAPGFDAARWNRPHNALAWVSLGLSIGFVILGTLSSIAAVICGHIARRQIRDRGEQGDLAAIWGLALGYVGIGVTLLGVLAFALFIAAVAGAAGVSSSL